MNQIHNIHGVGYTLLPEGVNPPCKTERQEHARKLVDELKLTYAQAAERCQGNRNPLVTSSPRPRIS